jgi:hypothetical protein
MDHGLQQLEPYVEAGLETVYGTVPEFPFWQRCGKIYLGLL